LRVSFWPRKSEQSTVAQFTRAFTCGCVWTWYVGKGFSDPAQEDAVSEIRTRDPALGSLYVSRSTAVKAILVRGFRCTSLAGQIESVD